MEYEYPRFIVDEGMKRLHVSPNAPSEELQELRKKCDIGDTTLSLPFMEAVRRINEEAYRPCGNCLEEGGETSNWKERAERAEQQVTDLEERLSDAEARATVSAERVAELEEASNG